MFESIIDRKKAEILRIPDFRGGYLYMPEILSYDSIADYVKNYFSTEIDWWIYQEKIIRESNVNFDFSDPEFSALDAELEGLLFKNARFDKLSFRILLDSAIKMQMNYLCRPRTTLKWFIFRGEPTKSEKEISLRLAYFSDYEYLLKQIADSDLLLKAKSDGGNINSIEFERLIEKIDNDKLFDLTPSEFVSLLEPLFSFLKTDTSGAIPISALLIFMDDKGLFPIVDSLQKFESSQNEKLITKDAFNSLLYSLIVHSDSEQSSTIKKTPEMTVPHREVIDYQKSKELFKSDEKYSQRELVSEDNFSDSVPRIDSKSGLEEDLLVSNSIENESPSNVERQIIDIPDEDELPAPGRYTPFRMLQDEADGELSVFDDFDMEIKLDKAEKPIGEPALSSDEISENIITIKEASARKNGHLELLEIEQSLPSGFISFDENFSGSVIQSEFNSFMSANSDIFKYSEQKPIEPTTEVESVVYDSSAGELKHMKELIDDRSENRFLKKIFNHDKSKYDSLIAELDNTNDWKSAAVILDLFFASKSIDPESVIAEEFRDIVQSRFIA